jgi:hypothetical protein
MAGITWKSFRRLRAETRNPFLLKMLVAASGLTGGRRMADQAGNIQFRASLFHGFLNFRPVDMICAPARESAARHRTRHPAESDGRKEVGR